MTDTESCVSIPRTLTGCVGRDTFYWSFPSTFDIYQLFYLCIYNKRNKFSKGKGYNVIT